MSDCLSAAALDDVPISPNQSTASATLEVVVHAANCPRLRVRPIALVAALALDRRQAVVVTLGLEAQPVRKSLGPALSAAVARVSVIPQREFASVFVAPAVWDVTRSSAACVSHRVGTEGALTDHASVMMATVARRAMSIDLLARLVLLSITAVAAVCV